MLEPCIGKLCLITVYYLLSEQTVLISERAAVSRKIESRERVDKACGKSAKTAVTQTCIVFKLRYLGKSIAQILKHRLIVGCLHEVQDVCCEQSAHKELK